MTQALERDENRVLWKPMAGPSNSVCVCVGQKGGGRYPGQMGFLGRFKGRIGLR